MDFHYNDFKTSLNFRFFFRNNIIFFFSHLPISNLRYLLSELWECFLISFLRKFDSFLLVPCENCFVVPFCWKSWNETWFCLTPSWCYYYEDNQIFVLFLQREKWKKILKKIKFKFKENYDLRLTLLAPRLLRLWCLRSLNMRRKFICIL